MSNEGSIMSKFLRIFLGRWFKKCEKAKDTPESIPLFPIQILHAMI